MTSTSGASNPRRRVPVAVAVMLAVLVLADLIVRVASASFPPTNDWNDWEATNKVIAMKALSKHGGAAVAFVGSSMTNAGADPALIGRVLGTKRPVFNAALNGADLEALDFWTLHSVVPLLHPRMVVIGVSSREFNDLASESVRFFHTMVASPAGKRLAGPGSLKDRVYTWAGDVSAIVRNRLVLRDPAAAWDPAPRQRLSVDDLGVLGALKVFLAGTYSVSSSFLGRTVHSNITPYAIRGREVTALGHLVRTLAKLKIVPVVVEMPVTSDLLPLHQHGAADYRAFEAALATFVSEHKAAGFINMAPLFSSKDEFRDPYHLNARGRLRFSTLMAERLRTLSENPA